VIKRPFGCLFELVETLVLTLVIFLVIQNFVAQPYRVQMQSMERTLEPNQYVLVDKLTPRFDTYKRGDIIVFTPPDDWVQIQDTPFIKRVIGVAGDRIEIHDDGQVYINSVALQEAAYVFDEDLRTSEGESAIWTVESGSLFVMGDHRSNSADSRTSGTTPLTAVLGRAWLRYWPFDTFGVLPTPTYPELKSAGS